MTRTSKRSIELDFVRGIAILLVMGYHSIVISDGFWLYRALEYPGKKFGATGVDLFFVLSGFLVGGLLLEEYQKTGAVRIKRFIFRRGFKIWPLYFSYVLFQIVVRRFPYRTFLLQNLLQIQNYTGTALHHTWTLSLEEHFYLLLALAMAYMTSRRWPAERLLAAFVFVSFAVIASRTITIYLGHPDAANFYTHNRLDALLFGVILATVRIFFPRAFGLILKQRAYLAGISLLLFLYLSTLGTSLMNIYCDYFGYGAFMLLAIGHSGRLKTMLWYRVIARIGIYSYGIYLWHVSVRHPCIWLASHLPRSVQWPSAMALQFITAIGLGWVMTRLIEWPFLRLRDRYYPSSVGAVSAPDIYSAQAGGEQLPQEIRDEAGIVL